MNSYIGYLDLLSKSYEKAVELLLQEYGPAQDDYKIAPRVKKF